MDLEYVHNAMSVYYEGSLLFFIFPLFTVILYVAIGFWRFCFRIALLIITYDILLLSTYCWLSYKLNRDVSYFRILCLLFLRYLIILSFLCMCSKVKQ